MQWCCAAECGSLQNTRRGLCHYRSTGMKLAEDGVSSMKVLCDDTDVFVLRIHYYAPEH